MFKLNSVKQMLRNPSALHCMFFRAQTEAGNRLSMQCVWLQYK